jgi:hypothetical protein
MFTGNHSLNYSAILILSIGKCIGKRSFRNLGLIVGKSGDTIQRMIRPAAESVGLMYQIAKYLFRDKSELFLVIDDTLIKKIHSRLMEGAGMFYDTKTSRLIMAYRLMTIGVTDGYYKIPLGCSFMFAKELISKPIESKDELVQKMILHVMERFPDKKFIVLADGIFATKEFFSWCIQNNIAAETRIHSNRKVEYQGQQIVIRNIAHLRPKGRQRARTICVLWHGIMLYITADKRIDKHGTVTVVFQASTYKAKPVQHVANYKKRWRIEKLFRTTKQYLGLQECFSTKIEVQFNHVNSVLLAYAFLELERKKLRMKTPEDVLRALGSKKYENLKQRLSAWDQIFEGVHA